MGDEGLVASICSADHAHGLFVCAWYESEKDFYIFKELNKKTEETLCDM